MTKQRDEFPLNVIRTVALRAGHVCSNPDCRLSTAGPHSDPAKAVITGQAAHICAAAEGGPRYKASQTTEERKSIRNAIWLCGNCNKKVDTDWKAWPVSKLLQMKEEHEKWISGQGMIPAMPDIRVITRSGLRTHECFAALTQEILNHLREQELCIRNVSRMPMHNFKFAINLPESILTYGYFQKPLSSHFAAKPAIGPWTVESVQPGGKIIATKPGPIPNHTLEIDVLPASEAITISCYTFAPAQMMLYDTIDSPPRPCEDPDAIIPPDLLNFFVEGTYQFLLRGEYVTADIFVPLRYSWRKREITTLPGQTSPEGWRVAPISIFPPVQLQG
jgi:hypothetical protein